MPVQRGNLKPEDYARIKRNYRFLIQEIDGKFLAPHLFSEGVITSDDKDEIKALVRRDDRNEVLIDMILHSGPGNSYSTFIKVLAQDYPHVVETLQEADIESAPTAMPYDWFDQLSDSIKSHVIKDRDASRIAAKLGSNWEHLMYRLDMRPVDIEREKSNNSNPILCITSLLIKWRQRKVNDANIKTLMSCLIELEDSALLTIDWEGLRAVIESIDDA